MAKNAENTDLIVKSIALCAVVPVSKKQVPCAVVAYSKGSEICFTTMGVKKLIEREDVFEAIAEAEDVKHITYLCGGGGNKDIYVCRAEDGKIFDLVARTEQNRYKEGFAEITATDVRFSIKNLPIAWKLGEKFHAEVSAVGETKYERNGFEFAVVNAYNACLLGRVFEKEELVLETKEKKRVKIEVRNVVTQFLESESLYIKPVSRDGDGFTDYYLTEEFNYIDGEDISRRAYKIMYTNRLNDYTIVRQ